MADVFLMGTAGQYSDPSRSMWREPIKDGLRKLNVTFYDPVQKTWTEEAAAREAQAMVTAKILVMAILPNTAGIAGLAESGWMVLSAVLRKQMVGIFVDPVYEGTKYSNGTMMIRREMLLNSPPDTLEESSRRARKLVNSHARKLGEQFPKVNLYIAKDLTDLTEWTLRTAQDIIVKPKKRSRLF
jgi:Nucleoside 2-deoxyribosyltransferase like